MCKKLTEGNASEEKWEVSYRKLCGDEPTMLV